MKLAYHASLSRRRSPVRIRSGAPRKYTTTWWYIFLHTRRGSKPARRQLAGAIAGSAKCSEEKLACSFFKQTEERSDILNHLRIRGLSRESSDRPSAPQSPQKPHKLTFSPLSAIMITISGGLRWLTMTKYLAMSQRKDPKRYDGNRQKLK